MARLIVEKDISKYRIAQKQLNEKDISKYRIARKQLNRNSEEQSKVDSGLARAQAEVEQQVWKP